jgi:hypothetical protein
MEGKLQLVASQDVVAVHDEDDPRGLGGRDGAGRNRGGRREHLGHGGLQAGLGLGLPGVGDGAARGPPVQLRAVLRAELVVAVLAHRPGPLIPHCATRAFSSSRSPMKLAMPF